MFPNSMQPSILRFLRGFAVPINLQYEVKRSLLVHQWIPSSHWAAYCTARLSHVPTHTEAEVERGIAITPAEQKKLLKKKPVQPVNPHILRVAIIGCPNAGKSTLANQLMGWRFSSVSGKVHTTRQKSIGILTEGNTQVIFLDTPGLITPQKRKKHGLERSLLTDPHSSLFEADLIAVVTDVSTTWGRNYLEPELLKSLHLHRNKKSILVLNKTDCVRRKSKLLKATRILTEGIVGGQRDSHEIKKSLDPLQEVERLLNTMPSQSQTETRSSQEEYCDITNELVQESSNSGAEHGQNFSDNIDDDCKDISEAHPDSMKHPSLLRTQSSVSESGHSLPSSTDAQVSHTVQPFEDGKLDDESVVGVSSTGEGSGENVDVGTKMDPSSVDLMQALPHQWSPDVWHLYHQQLKKAHKAIRKKAGWPHFDDIFMVCALDGDGVEELKDYLISCARPGRWKYHSALITDQDPLEIARLCVWEKCMDQTPDEVPYSLDVRAVLWEVDENGMLWTSFDIICARKRHLFSTLGKGGETLKAIATAAKQELMNTFQTELSLKLSVRMKDSI